ncbi:B12-binding domain-containing radical SAM protein [Patescibacteria group bacterium]|nr:B12-binding domain-containing radical SAM protein [Patescibacteria group bacterium]MBU1970533.1 B12-binding domain-containing radical SAM protein [Patescibacteria group bacterium]
MKIAIGYPPIESEKGTPLLSQNRQFQYFNAPTYIYPMVPAYAASLAKQRGYEVAWLDGIASQQSYSQWLNELQKESPDLLLVETKAPVVKKHWKIVNELKERFPKMLIVMVGDHVTYDPKETLANCRADYIITGGDYDFLLSDLADALTKGMVLPGGIWGRTNDQKVKLGEVAKSEEGYWFSGPLVQRHKLDELPFIDRDLTKWQLYAYQNGNYKYTPGTYLFSGRDCWWAKCTFCIWDHSLYPHGTYRRFSPERLFAEVKHVVDNYQVKEIFDDAGTLMVGPPLKKFCELLIESGYHKKVVFSCNMRLNALNQEYYDLMAKANFRYILYGMESANQETLDKLNKGLKVEQIEEGLGMAKKAGLEPHITVMLGYPWETEEMARNTIALAKKLFKKYVDTMQATIVVPYPGTPLYKECVEKDWLAVDPKDYEAFDMRKPVMKVPFPEERLFEMTQELYASFCTPQYLMRKILSVRKWDDVKFYAMSAKRLLAHLLDFDKNQTRVNMLSPKFWIDAGRSMFSHLVPQKNDRL